MARLILSLTLAVVQFNSHKHPPQREPLATLKDMAALNTFVTKEGRPAGFVFFGDSDAHRAEHVYIPIRLARSHEL